MGFGRWARAGGGELVVGLLLGAGVAGLAGYLVVVRPTLADARERDQQARQRLAQQVEYLRTLRVSLQAEPASPASAASASAAGPASPAAAASDVGAGPRHPATAPSSGRAEPRKRPLHRVPRPAAARADDPLGELSLDGNDPLEGLVDRVKNKPLRRPR